mmetsp:Transcript_75211/g.195599  ORF Transcript_75211/g.195599 Transcript_75211/m.195599 type:complete len:259 (-) Transcript_75211:661-1437(-)
MCDCGSARSTRPPRTAFKPRSFCGCECALVCIPRCAAIDDFAAAPAAERGPKGEAGAPHGGGRGGEAEGMASAGGDASKFEAVKLGNRVMLLVLLLPSMPWWRRRPNGGGDDAAATAGCNTALPRSLFKVPMGDIIEAAGRCRKRRSPISGAAASGKSARCCRQPPEAARASAAIIAPHAPLLCNGPEPLDAPPPPGTTVDTPLPPSGTDEAFRPRVEFAFRDAATVSTGKSSKPPRLVPQPSLAKSLINPRTSSRRL